MVFLQAGKSRMLFYRSKNNAIKLGSMALKKRNDSFQLIHFSRKLLSTTLTLEQAMRALAHMGVI